MLSFSLSLRHTSSKAQKGSSIATTTNEAYGIIKLEQMDEHVYDVIDACAGTNPSLADGTNKNPCLAPSNRLLPNIPPIVAPPTSENVCVARKGEEEVAYATIPGDQ